MGNLVSVSYEEASKNGDMSALTCINDELQIGQMDLLDLPLLSVGYHKKNAYRW